jgi:outer membrane protein assembly factor BamB
MTSLTRILATATVGAALASIPALSQQIRLDYHNPAELVGYRTYTIQDLHATDPALEARLAAAIERDLDRKGWHEVADHGNVAVTAVVANSDDRNEYAAFYGGMNDLRWNVAAPGDASDSIAQSPAGTLVVDMYDTHTGQLIWRSTANDFLSNNIRRDGIKVDTAVDKMFNKLPWNDSPNLFNGLNAIPE